MTDASLQKIAATYGTPTFVFDTDALQARVRAIQTIWGREIDLCYSIKANPFLLPAMMQVTARLEVCSPGELSLCESLHAADARCQSIKSQGTTCAEIAIALLNQLDQSVLQALGNFGQIICRQFPMSGETSRSGFHVYHLITTTCQYNNIYKPLPQRNCSL